MAPRPPTGLQPAALHGDADVYFAGGSPRPSAPEAGPVPPAFCASLQPRLEFGDFDDDVHYDGEQVFFDSEQRSCRSSKPSLGLRMRRPDRSQTLRRSSSNHSSQSGSSGGSTSPHFKIPMPASSRGMLRSRSRSSESMGSGKSPKTGSREVNDAIVCQDNVSPQMKRSRSSDSKITPTQPATPSLRRSISAHSASSGTSHPSQYSHNTYVSSATPNTQTSSSVPPMMQLDMLRECSTVSLVREYPACRVYDFAERLGSGGEGQVWRCVHKETSEAYAVKCVPASQKLEDATRLLNDLRIFQRLHSPYTVKLHEVFLEQDFVYLVMDYCSGGDLAQFMETFVDAPGRLMQKMEFPDQVIGLPTRLVGCFLWQILAGIAYMHHHRFCHRDIKLQNCVVAALSSPSRAPVLQLVDFGMAMRFKKGQNMLGAAGTVKYMAPEVLRGCCNERCDVWAAGIVGFILATERSPWGANKTKQEMCHCIQEDIQEPWPVCDKPEPLKALIASMLDRDMEERPSAKALLKRKWLMKHAPSATDAARQQCCTIS